MSELKTKVDTLIHLADVEARCVVDLHKVIARLTRLDFRYDAARIREVMMELDASAMKRRKQARDLIDSVGRGLLHSDEEY